MPPAIHGRLHLLPAIRERAAVRTPDWLFSTFLALVAIAVLVTVISSAGAERRALRRLPADERRALVTRTVEELRQVCAGPRGAGLGPHCRELASFAAQFDECMGECEALVRRELTPSPTR